MRTAALIVVLGLVASSMAFQAFQKSKPFKVNNKELEAAPVKKTVTFGDLVAFFQTHDFQVNDQLTSFFDDLNNQILTEHNQQLALYTQQQQECSDEYTLRNNAIAAGQAAYDASQTQLNAADSEQTRASNLANLATQALSIYNQQLATLQAQRAAQVALYQQQLASLNNAIAQVATASNILDEFELEAQGVVPPSLIQTVNTLLALTVRTGHSHKVLPVYTRLIQSTQNGFDVTDIQELRDLFDTIAANLQTSLNGINDAEAQNEATFDASQSALEAVIAKLTNQLNAANDYLNRLQGIIDQETSISLQAQGKVTRNTQLLQQAQTLCADATAEFQQGEATRRTQLELIAQLQSAVGALEAQYSQSLLPDVSGLISGASDEISVTSAAISYHSAQASQSQ